MIVKREVLNIVAPEASRSRVVRKTLGVQRGRAKGQGRVPGIEAGGRVLMRDCNPYLKVE